jgi:hypothetical protein
MRNSIICSLLAMAGCAELDEDSLDVELSETSSEIAVGISKAFDTTDNNDGPFDIGATTSSTCFLRGLSGDVYGIPRSPSNPLGLPAIADVYASNGKWWVKVRAGAGSGIKAHVQCVAVPYSPAGKEFSWSDNNDAGAGSVPASANRYCFLRKIWASHGLTSFPNNPTYITIKKVDPPGPSGAVFTMAGSHVNDSSASATGGFGGATATCIDFAATGVWNFATQGPGPNATGSSTVWSYLRDYWPDGPVVPSATAACGFTSVSSKWANPNPSAFGLDDGVVLARSSGWFVTATNGKKAAYTCIR